MTLPTPPVKVTSGILQIKAIFGCKITLMDTECEKDDSANRFLSKWLV